MLPNPFLQQIGPQGLNPEAPNYPQVDPEAANYNAALRARELSYRMGISRMVRGQQQGNAGLASMLAAREGGKLLGTTLSTTTAAALEAGSSLPAEAAGSAIPAATTAAQGASIAGAAAQGLGVAATAYGTYESNRAASNSIRDLQDAIAGGNMSPEEEAAARAKVFRAGITSQNLGGIGGGLAGWAVGGPAGAVIGAVAGGSGGARQAWDSYDNNSDRLRAAWKMQTNPFKH